MSSQTIENPVAAKGDPATLRTRQAIRQIFREPVGSVRRALESVDWDFSNAPIRADRHGLAGYPARFIPEIPRQLIELLSAPGDLVADPFCGGGTTLLESARLNRDSIGVDASAWAALQTRVKTSRPSTDDVEAIAQIASAIEAATRDGSPGWAPTIPNRARWFGDDVFNRLRELRQLITAAGSGIASDVGMLAFCQLAAKSSYQESEARYVSAPRQVDINTMGPELAKEIRRFARILTDEEMPSGVRCEVRLGDASTALSQPALAGRVGLIVTSPPYPNAYDYHLYQRFRLMWLGVDPTELRRIEVGSHLRSQSDPDAPGTYRREMSSVLEAAFQALAPGRFAAFVVGDGVYDGATFATSTELQVAAEAIGFRHVATIDRMVHPQRRSIGVGRRLEREQILVLRRSSGTQHVVLELPSYSRKDYELALLEDEIRGLATTEEIRVNSKGAEALVESADIPRLKALSFAKRITSPYDAPTAQWAIEGEPGQHDRRKNSNYLTHGLHRFKGKFYPQLAKAMLNSVGLPPGGVIVDPFGGSGTTMLEANLAGFEAWSLDCNPLSTAVSRTKRDLLDIDPKEFGRTLELVLKTARRSPRGAQPYLGFGSEVARREVVSWFARDVLRKLDSLYAASVRVDSDVIATALKLLLSDILRDVSQQDPKDLRIRRRAEPLVDAPVIEIFEQRANVLVRRLMSVRPKVLGIGHARTADSSTDDAYRPIDDSGRSIDAVVTSPPYASALPYIDTDRLSLVALFGLDSKDRRTLEDQLIGSRELSRTQAAVEEALIEAEFTDLPTSTSEFLRAYRLAIQASSAAGFRLKNAPAVLTRYFRSIDLVFANLAYRMHPGSTVFWVVGDSTSMVDGQRWAVPTVRETLSIAGHRGFRLEKSLPISVSRADVLHSRNTITENTILRLTRVSTAIRSVAPQPSFPVASAR